MGRTAREPDLALRAALGARVRNARLREGLSQEQLSFAADLSMRHVGNIERGLTNPSAEELTRLAHALRRQPGSLLPHIDQDGRPTD